MLYKSLLETLIVQGSYNAGVKKNRIAQLNLPANIFKDFSYIGYLEDLSDEYDLSYLIITICQPPPHLRKDVNQIQRKFFPMFLFLKSCAPS